MTKKNAKMMVWVVRSEDYFGNDGVWVAGSAEKAAEMVQILHNENGDEWYEEQYNEVLNTIKERDEENGGYSYLEENGISVMKLAINDFTM